MSVVLLASVGNRDLLVDGEYLSPELHRARGKEILDNIVNYRDRLSAPQITCCIDWILERQAQIDTVRLFVTDQPEGVEDRHRGKDTIYVGEAVKKTITKQFGGRLRAVRTSRISNGSPAVYDEMLDAVGQIVSSLPDRSEVETCYVLPVGGTPAVSAALLLQACRFFEARCVPLYLREGSRRPEPMDFATQIRRGLVRGMALERTRADDFGGVEHLLASLGEEARAEAAFAGYAHRRLNFDFVGAQRLIEQAMPALRGSERDLAVRLRDGLEVFCDAGRPQEERTVALMAELYHNARITFNAGRCVDFLGRAIRFQEATVRLAVERGFGVGTDERKDKDRFRELMAHNRPLMDYLKSKKANGAPLDPTRLVMPVFLGMLEYLVEEGSAAQPAAQGWEQSERAGLLTLVRRLDRLRGIRNRSIIAHDFKGVSMEELMAQYRKEDSPTAHPVEDMESIVRLVAGTVPEDVYYRIRRHIELGLERL